MNRHSIQERAPLISRIAMGGVTPLDTRFSISIEMHMEKRACSRIPSRS